MPPAWSIWLITQPPKISPLTLVSRGMAIRRTVSSPRGACSSDELAIGHRSPLFRLPIRPGLWRTNRHDAIETGEVLFGRGVDKVGLFRDCDHVRGLAGADFDHEPAASGKQGPRARQYSSIGVKAVNSAIERKPRIEVADLARQSQEIGARNIGRVRHDQVKAPVETSRPVAKPYLG